MKKLVVGSFAFVLAVMLATNVLAATLDITEYEGDNGLVGRSTPINKGDVLNIKNYITQTEDNTNDILSKGITINGAQDPQAGTAAPVDNSGRVTIDGGGYNGFYMEANASSTMNNLNLTSFYGTIIGVAGEDKAGNDIASKLTLNDVNITDNDGEVWIFGKKAELNIVSKSTDVFIGENYGFYVDDGATLNLKGNNIQFVDDVMHVIDDAKVNNSSNFIIDDATISIEEDAVFNNNGTINNRGTIYLGPGERKAIAEQEYHPTFNNNATIVSTGTITVDYGAIFNNNNKIINGTEDREYSGLIEIEDGGTFNNKGTLINYYGPIFVYGEFNNKGTVDSKEYIYVGKSGGPKIRAARSAAVIPDYDYEEDYAVFNNDSKVVSEGTIMIDSTGKFINNGTLVAKSVEREESGENEEQSYSQIVVGGILENTKKGKIDAELIIFNGGNPRPPVVDDVRDAEVLKAAAISDVDAMFDAPILKNYNVINISTGIVGNGIVYNNKTINLGGQLNTDFSGTVVVDNGTINLLEDSYYFNNAQQHAYLNGTLNLVNGYAGDTAVMRQLYLDGTMKVNLDVDLNPELEEAYGDEFEPAQGQTGADSGSESEVGEGIGDYLDIGSIITYEDQPENQYPEEQLLEKVVTEGQDPEKEPYTPIGNPKIVLNGFNILKDSKQKITEVEVASSEAQEYIRLGKKEALGVMFVYDVSLSSSDSSSSQGGEEIFRVSNDPTTGEVIEEESTAPKGEYGNIAVFKRRSNLSSLDSGERMEGDVHPGLAQGVVAAIGSSISQEEIFDTVLNNAGNYTFFQKQGSSAGDVEDRAAPTLWIKAFGSQEDVDMKNYTKVQATYYGAMVGLDWDRQYSDNFDATYGLFASYIGGEFKDDDWSDSDGDFKVKQNGGYVGLRGNWYFGKLFVNGIVDYGMIANGADNPYDSSDFNSSVIGLAARLGYNFEVSNKRFTIQPSVGVTGKYIMSDDFETKLKDDSEIKEEIDDIKNITVEPGLKLALNLGKCWILTGEGKYVIENYDGDTRVTGEGLDFLLPDMSYDNYANCGLGIEKIWGYTVLHVKGNKTFGGRDGYIINAGIEFKF